MQPELDRRDVVIGHAEHAPDGIGLLCGGDMDLDRLRHGRGATKALF
jgi:hypothetical protein